MIIKTSLRKPIYEFLNKNKIINLNLIGFLENVPDAEVYVDGDIASWVLMHNDNSMGIMYTKEEYRGRGMKKKLPLTL